MAEGTGTKRPHSEGGSTAASSKVVTGDELEQFLANTRSAIVKGVDASFGVTTDALRKHMATELNKCDTRMDGFAADITRMGTRQAELEKQQAEVIKIVRVMSEAVAVAERSQQTRPQVQEKP